MVSYAIFAVTTELPDESRFASDARVIIKPSVKFNGEVQMTLSSDDAPHTFTFAATDEQGNRLAELPQVLIARKDLPARNLQDFIAYARQHQAKMQYGSGGAGSGPAPCDAIATPS